MPTETIARLLVRKVGRVPLCVRPPHVRTRGARRLVIWPGWPDSWRLTGEANRSKEAQGKFAPSDLRTRF